jgi:hypothetical protein
LLAAAPGLVIWFAGLVVIIRASGPAARLRGGRMMALGFGLFVAGLALSLVLDGVARGSPALVLGTLVVQGPIVVVFFWIAFRMK